MIWCLGPSPALDRTQYVSHLTIGEVNRSTRVVVQAGGKAANVARVIHTIGGSATLVGPVGRGTGEEVRTRAESEGIMCRWSPSSLSTRVCTTIVDSEGVATDVNEPSMIDAAGWDQLVELVSQGSVDASHVLLSGAMPELPDGRLVSQLADAVDPRCGLWVDTSGPALRQLTAGTRPVDVVKVNLDEALTAVRIDCRGRSRLELSAVVSSELQRQTGGVAVVTVGSQGAVLADRDRCWYGKLPVENVINPTGSGDSFLAGLAVAVVERSASWPEALALALACAASNVGHLGAGQIDVSTLPNLVEAAVVEELTDP